MLVVVALPVQEIDSTPGPKYSMIELVPPDTVRTFARYIIISFGAVHPDISPVRCTPISLGYLTSQGSPAITSAASAPPTPHASVPRPPAFGV